MKKKCFTLIELLFLLAILAFILALVFGRGGCANTSPDEVIGECHNLGFTEVRIIETTNNFANGSQGDSVRYTVEALNSKGEKVRLYVFAGAFTKPTIRGVN